MHYGDMWGQWEETKGRGEEEEEEEEEEEKEEEKEEEEEEDLFLMNAYVYLSLFMYIYAYRVHHASPIGNAKVKRKTQNAKKQKAKYINKWKQGSIKDNYIWEKERFALFLYIS